MGSEPTGRIATDFRGTGERHTQQPEPLLTQQPKSSSRPLNASRKVASLKFDGLFVRSLKASGTGGRSANYWKDTKGEPCVYCGGPAHTKEHLRTKLKGGTDGWENCVRACDKCNSRRQQLPPLWFYAVTQGRLDQKDLLKIANHVNTLGTFPLRSANSEVLAPVRRDHRV